MNGQQRLRARTIQAWVRYQGNGLPQLIFEQGNSKDGGDFLLRRTAVCKPWLSARYRQEVAESSLALQVGRMTHVTAVLDISPVAEFGSLILYQDGQEIARNDNAPAVRRSFDVSGIGGWAKSSHNSFRTGYGIWRGIIADVRIDNRAQ